MTLRLCALVHGAGICDMEIRFEKIKVTLPPDGRTLFRIHAWRVPAGEHLLIQGASGLGKTTLLHLAAGLFVPETGDVHLGPHHLNALSDEERCRIRRGHVGLVFQKLNLLDHLTALENVLLGQPPATSKKDARAAALAALERVGMAALAGARSAVLSLGEQQRVAVARVLAAKPDIVLADEPTSSLDQANADAVMSALVEVARDRTLVVVSHDHRIQSRFHKVINFSEMIAR